MSETVFIIGAGVSKGAGAPLMGDFLDVANRMRKGFSQPDPDFELVFRGIDALQAVHSKATMDLINLESVFAAFEMAVLLGELKPLTAQETLQLPQAMSRLIQRTLEATISFPASAKSVHAPHPYNAIVGEIAKMKNHTERVSFITFNYDICLDYALHSHSLYPSYCLDEWPGPHRIKLLKLHGSLNWTRCPGCQKVVPWQLEDFFKGRYWPSLGDVAQVKIGIASELSKFKHCGDEHATAPYVAPPTWNKTQYHKQLEHVWRAAGAELSSAENVIICGYSLPETDQFFRYLYALGSVGRAHLRRVWVINPDVHVEPRFKSLCGPVALARFRFFKVGVEDMLPDIGSVLSSS